MAERPNPFAKYAQEEEAAPQASPSARPNPFAKYTKPAAKPTQDNPTWGEVGRGAWQNIKKGPVEMLQKAHQAVKDPVNTAYNLASGTMDAADALKGMTPEKAWGALKAAGGMYATRYGTLDGFKRDLRDHPYQIAADLATVLTLPAGSGATVGGRAAGAVGLTAPTSRVGQVAARAAQYTAVPTHGLNDAAALAARTVPRVARGVDGVMHPTNGLMLRTAEGQAPAINNALRANPTARRIIPGSNPTPSQVVANPGRTIPGHPAPAPVTAPRFAALDKAAQKRLPGPAQGAKEAQNAARLTQIRQIGKTKADLDAATKARDANAAAKYATAYRTNLAADDDFHNLLFERPSMGKVMARAEDIAKEKGVPFATGTNARATATTPASYANYPTESLHIVKQAFDDIAFDPNLASRYGIGASELRAIQGTRGNFIKWVEDRNPDYRAAREGYALESGPIDRMKIGQYLEQKLQNPTLADDTAALRADDFSRAVQDAVTANPNIKKATGQQRYDNLSQILPPGEMQILTGIQDDLGRAKLADTHAAAGSRYADDLNTAFTDALGVDANRWWSRGPAAIANDHIADDVARRMQTPEGAAELMQNAMRHEMDMDLYGGVYNRAINTDTLNPFRSPNTYNPVRLGFRYPLLLNAYTAQQQQPTNSMTR